MPELYPQDGDRIVIIDSVTSLHPMYTLLGQLSLASLRGRLIEYRLRLG